jgi:hypothetical protein
VDLKSSYMINIGSKWFPVYRMQSNVTAILYKGSDIFYLVHSYEERGKCWSDKVLLLVPERCVFTSLSSYTQLGTRLSLVSAVWR